MATTSSRGSEVRPDYLSSAHNDTETAAFKLPESVPSHASASSADFVAKPPVRSTGRTCTRDVNRAG